VSLVAHQLISIHVGPSKFVIRAVGSAPHTEPVQLPASPLRKFEDHECAEMGHRSPSVTDAFPVQPDAALGSCENHNLSGTRMASQNRT
jgi:hypothetical protein